jgi:SAM-dependent methyltransferase
VTERAISDQAAFGVGAYPELAKAEPGHFWFRNRNRLIAWALGRYFPDARDFLEVGCGTGFVLAGLREAYPELSLRGGELYEEGLEVARARLPGVRLEQLDARRMSFDREFDVIGAFDVIEHIPEDGEALARIHRAVRPGGGILVTVPQHPWLWSRADEAGRHQRRYTRRELVSKLEAAGFEVVRVTSFVTLLLPALILSRLADRRRKRPYDPMDEFRLPGAVNGAMELLLRVETAAIRSGLSLPAGGSLLAVGRRPRHRP